jgi:hypothetical protein
MEIEQTARGCRPAAAYFLAYGQSVWRCRQACWWSSVHVELQTAKVGTKEEDCARTSYGDMTSLLTAFAGSPRLLQSVKDGAQCAILHHNTVLGVESLTTWPMVVMAGGPWTCFFMATGREAPWALACSPRAWSRQHVRVRLESTEGGWEDRHTKNHSDRDGRKKLN